MDKRVTWSALVTLLFSSIIRFMQSFNADERQENLLSSQNYFDLVKEILIQLLLIIVRPIHCKCTALTFNSLLPR